MLELGVTPDKPHRKSARIVAQQDGQYPTIKIDGKKIDPTEVSDFKLYANGTSATVESAAVKQGTVYFASWLHPVSSKAVITITPDSFPGTYYVTGDTMIRNERNGEDEYFQFVIPKAKMQAEQTISMEAEGDPSTFNMSLEVLRPEDGEMIRFIQYSFVDLEDDTEENDNLATGTTTSSDGWVNKV